MNLKITDFGAIGDGKTLDTSAIQAAIDQAHASGGGKVVVPASKTFLSGSLELRENVELHVEAGATLLASSDYNDYTHNISELTGGLVSETVLPQRSFIVGYLAHNSSITGSGNISGNADGFILERGRYIHTMRAPAGGKSQYLERPFTIFMIESQNLLLSEFTLLDPAFWAIRTTGCNDLTIAAIKILTDLMVPNADGIDIDRCQRVRITNCDLVTADDCISLKSCAGTSQYGDVSDVVIENCRMVSTSGAITLGTESVGDILRVRVSDCVVARSHRGFAVRAREGGTISDVVFENSKFETRAFSPMWWGHGEALHVTAFAWSSAEHLDDGNPERLLEGKVTNITFRNLEVQSEAGILNWAAQPSLLSGIRYEDIKLKIGSSSKWPHRIDLRPNDIQPTVERPHNAFEAVNVSNVVIAGLDIEWEESSRQNYGVAVFTQNTSGFLQSQVTESSITSFPTE
jgi:polygalacturonase